MAKQSDPPHVTGATPGAATATTRWMKRLRRAGRAALPWLLAGGGLAAQAATTVLIAAEDDWAPYSHAVQGSSEPQGLAADIVREAFASQGVTAQFVVVPFARCMLMAQNGQAVGCFNATIISDNRNTYHWHPTPMFQEELAIFGTLDKLRRDLKLADLAGHSVGYTLGYTYPSEFQDDPNIRRVSAKSDRVLIEMLGAGRVDYILLNTAPGYLRINAVPALKDRIGKVGVISQDGFWIAFTRAKPEGEVMAATFERGLAALKANGRYDALTAAFRKRVGF